MFLKINENKFSLSGITKLEEQVEQSILMVKRQYEKLFLSESYILDIKLERINELKALKGDKNHAMIKEQCLDPNYQSFISLAVKNQDGSLIGNEDDGYLIENIQIWSVNKSLITQIKFGYINKLSQDELRNEIIKVIDEFIDNLKFFKS